MKINFLAFLLIAFAFQGFGQKKLIDSVAFDKWSSLHDPFVSKNGMYVAYTLEKYLGEESAIVVCSVDNKWKKVIIGGSEARFTQDGQKLIYKIKSDSLFVCRLGTVYTKFIACVQAYQLLPNKKKELVLLQVVGSKEIRLYDIASGSVILSQSANVYNLNYQADILVMQRDVGAGEYTRNIVEWIDMGNGQSRNIWESLDIAKNAYVKKIIFDQSGKQMAFTVEESNNGKSEISVWMYKQGMKKAVKKVSSQMTGLQENCMMVAKHFSQDGSKLFLELTCLVNVLPDDRVNVDIWSHADEKFVSQQLPKTKKSEYVGVINLDSSHLIILKKENERIFNNSSTSDDYTLVTKEPYTSMQEENHWRSTCRQPLYLVNTNDGTRLIVKDGLLYNHINGISPDNRFVIYFDYELKSFFSFNIKNGKTVNISKNIPNPVYNETNSKAKLPGPYSLISNWLPENKGLIVYDQFDIWQVDPTGLAPPVCLTGGYGRKHGIILRLPSIKGVITEKQLLLSAFRPSDKSNGFFKLDLTKTTLPELLTMGPYLYYWPYTGGLFPIKAENANIWLLQRMGASEAPNYYITKDFKRFQRLTELEPQKGYNWLTAELHEWKMVDGKTAQGILYKPENFDPKKKYPVIFHFYERKSDQLNRFILPEKTGDEINIPHFVSNGYLVFTPDIYYSIGEPAESISKTVITAAQYLGKMPFVDSTKMGLQGHSFGGYEVNVLITKTGMFAAAAEAAGECDLISAYGSVGANGESFQSKYEIGQYRIGSSIWEKPELYIRNSPIFEADKVTTPLLIMHCKRDESVPFEQAVQWFTALRRLGKMVWMLQYDMGGHQLAGKEAEDYTVRLMQFFDYYLKGGPVVNWMRPGLPQK